jgi:hypothetical protein
MKMIGRYKVLRCLTLCRISDWTNSSNLHTPRDVEGRWQTFSSVKFPSLRSYYDELRLLLKKECHNNDSIVYHSYTDYMYKPMNKYSVACFGIRFQKPYNNVHSQILGFRSQFQIPSLRFQYQLTVGCIWR